MKSLLRKLILLVLSVTFIYVSCDTSPTGVDDTDNGNDHPPFSHTLGPGASFEEFLLEERFDELLIEIQYMPGYEPEEESLAELVSFLEEHLNKTITLLEPEEVPPGGQETYTANDIRNLEDEHRSHFSEGNTLASYNLFVDGEFDQGNVLGIAYYNTSNAYFGETIHRISGGIGEPSREKVEGTVFRHEYGHLFGLVDNGLDMQEEHQENGPHCTEEDCVMYYAVRTTDFFANLFDGTIPDLDDFCRDDIESIR